MKCDCLDKISSTALAHLSVCMADAHVPVLKETREGQSPSAPTFFEEKKEKLDGWQSAAIFVQLNQAPATDSPGPTALSNPLGKG